MVKAVVLGAAGESIIFIFVLDIIFTQSAGGIGQPLALLLKANPLVSEAHLFHYTTFNY
jgi:hypothetical protein